MEVPWTKHPVVKEAALIGDRWHCYSYEMKQKIRDVDPTLTSMLDKLSMELKENRRGHHT